MQWTITARGGATVLAVNGFVAAHHVDQLPSTVDGLPGALRSAEPTWLRPHRRRPHGGQRVVARRRASARCDAQRLGRRSPPRHPVRTRRASGHPRRQARSHGSMPRPRSGHHHLPGLKPAGALHHQRAAGATGKTCSSAPRRTKMNRQSQQASAGPEASEPWYVDDRYSHLLRVTETLQSAEAWVKDHWGGADIASRRTWRRTTTGTCSAPSPGGRPNTTTRTIRRPSIRRGYFGVIGSWP